MNLIDRAIAAVAPRLALDRARARAALGVVAHYDAATAGGRAKSWRPVAGDADTASFQRQRLSFVARDMVRNTAFAQRAQQVIANNVVGDGIIPKVICRNKRAKADILSRIERHFDTTAIDAHGRCNLYGLQRLAMNAVVVDGEAFIRHRTRDASDGLALPFQLEVLEIDYLDTTRSQSLRDGRRIEGGIEFDAIGRRRGYWMYQDHPGSSGYSIRQESRFVSADQVIHLYRQDRPGQQRGASWFAPIALQLQDMADHQEAQLMRQKIAACFAAFRVMPDSDPLDAEDPAGLSGSLIPGRIQNLAPGEDIRFATPPGAEGYDEFTRNVLRAVAAGLGVTYEALTGDLSSVNFSSARMGRMEMDRNISAWQWLMMIPQMMQPIAEWALKDWRLLQMGTAPAARIDWVPPHRVLVDPTREIPALGKKVELGLASRSSVIRDLGYDPERVIEEIKADAVEEQRLGLRFGTSVYEQETDSDE